MTTDRFHLDEAALQLQATDLPVEVFSIKPDRGRLVVFVHDEDLGTAELYFKAHPVKLPNGVKIEVDVGVGGGGWYAFPQGTPESARLDVAQYTSPTEPEHLNLSRLVGMNIDDATDMATGLGWLVRVIQGAGPMTADLRCDRLTVCCSSAGVVESADQY